MTERAHVSGKRMFTSRCLPAISRGRRSHASLPVLPVIMGPHGVMGASQCHGASACYGSFTRSWGLTVSWQAHDAGTQHSGRKALYDMVVSERRMNICHRMTIVLTKQGLYGRKHALFRQYQIWNKTCYEENRRESHAFHPQIINKAHVLAQGIAQSMAQSFNASLCYKA